CDECDENFTQKSTFTQHMHTHTEEKPFACTDCGKSFTWKSHLAKHRCIHNGEKP
ncbi:Zinc finger imprinted 3, partial [Merops nubicus]